MEATKCFTYIVIHQLVDDHLKDWLICGTNTELPLWLLVKHTKSSQFIRACLEKQSFVECLAHHRDHSASDTWFDVVVGVQWIAVKSENLTIIF